MPPLIFRKGLDLKHEVAHVPASSAGDTRSVSGAVGAPTARMLTDEEIEAGASDVPADASTTDRERR